MARTGVSEHYYDPQSGGYVLNTTGVANDEVMTALWDQHPEVASVIRWANNVQSRQQGLFERDKYVTPLTPYRQMKVAYEAAQIDDVVSNVIESTEAMAFSKMSFECDDPDEQNIWNQIAADLDLDSRFREMWREQFTVSQFYSVIWWGTKSYKVGGKSDKGVSRKKTFTNLTVPTGLTLLDPLKIVPVGNFLFNQESLAYIATRTEAEVFYDVLAGRNTSDLMVSQLILGPYEPDFAERAYLAGNDVDPNHLFLLNPHMVWRHTDTRPQYERFANIRMKSIFELLDLKHQLREMDRSWLVGGPLRVDQRVATPHGWQPIGTMQVGDQVFGVDGKPANVIGVFPQGVLEDMYRVTFSDGAEVICDGSHPWTVEGESSQRRRPRTISLNQILAEGLVTRDGSSKHRIPVAQPIELSDKDLPLDPYLVGYMLGDGSFTQSMPKITSAEVNDFPWIECLPKGIFISQYETRKGFCPQYGLRGVSQGKRNPLTNLLRVIALWGVVDVDKFIPDDYLWGSIDQRWALLQGLLDSDGSVGQSGGAEFGSCSSKLAHGVADLVRSLGGVARLTERQPVGKGKRVCYRVYISLNQVEAPFRLKRKVAAWTPRKYPIVRGIRAVERVPAAEAVCIKIDREDGLFLTEDMVVTHNTNYLVLVTLGTDQIPAKQAEVAALAGQMRIQARVPVIVGDHRLNIQIITPKTEHTLQPDQYNTLDSRIEARLYQMFLSSNSAVGRQSDDSLKMARVISRGLEGRRHQLNRAFHRSVIKPVYEANDQFTGEPKLVFHPKMIALDYDAAFIQMLQDLRDRGDLSRASILDQFDFDQDDEARKREIEADKFDDTFSPPNNIPFSSPGQPGPAGSPSPKAAGRRGGGTSNGGGQNADSKTPNNRPANPRKGTPKNG